MYQEEIRKQIINLGISTGDTVLVRASLSEIGSICDQKITGNILISELLEVVGPEGTIIGLAFTKNMLVYGRKGVIYQKDSPATTGGLANLMLKWPGAIRSDHPTNSFVAIGKNADYLLSEHGVKSFCFQPIKKLIELNGKMILVGCAESSPGFSTVHLVQYELGLATKSVFTNKLGAYYYDTNGVQRLFKKKDIPGCSMGFGKFYPYYVANNMLNTGYIGSAYSICIAARDAYAIEYPLIKGQPCFPLCDDQSCFDCRAGWFYNWRDWPAYYRKLLLKVLKIRT